MRELARNTSSVNLLCLKSMTHVFIGIILE